MSKDKVVHDSFVIERIYKASPERVFAAFADPAQKRCWFAEGEAWTVESFEADFREGGFERSRFRLHDGPVMGNDTVYHDIVANRRIVSSYAMTMGGTRFSVSLATVEFEPHASGTLMRSTEQAAFFEDSDGVERRRQGWGVLLDRLGAQLEAAPAT